MLLQKLREYADLRMDSSPTLYSPVKVRYKIILDAEGRLLSHEPIDLADDKNKRGREMLVPYILRTSAVFPYLVTDKSEYALGYVGEDSKPLKVQEKHDAYLKLLQRCIKATGEPAVQAVLTFLQSNPLAQLQLPNKFSPSDVVTFQIGLDTTTVVSDLPGVQKFWAAINDKAKAKAEAVAESEVVAESSSVTAKKGKVKDKDDVQVMQCVVCGQQRPVLKTIGGAIKGVPGGQVAGTSLISANSNAFWSYGLEYSLVAPTCAECGEKFTKAANTLLANNNQREKAVSRYTLGDTAFIFWTKEPVADDDWFETFVNPDPQKVRDLLRSLHKGGPRTVVDAVPFYAAALSASGARTVVRDWIDTTLGEANRQLALWFDRQRIVSYEGDVATPLGLYALAAAGVRDASKELKPPTMRAMLRAAMTSAPLPLDLLARAVNRNRAEQTVNRSRAALTKLVLTSRNWEKLDLPLQLINKEDFMVQIEKNLPNVAYHCGRLLAVLEQAQDLAISGPKGNNAKNSGPKAGVVNRFYGAASATPALVFGFLLKGVTTAHLPKLQRDRPGAAHRIEVAIEEIMAQIPSSGFPKTLNQQQQGMFGLGYYHQKAESRAQAKAASARKLAGNQPTADRDEQTDSDDGQTDSDEQ